MTPEAQRECGPQEHLFAFLDDVYATSDVPDRTRTLYDAQAGIRFHTEKTSMEQSVVMSCRGPEVWNPEGVKILGTPVGSQRFIQEVADK